MVTWKACQQRQVSHKLSLEGRFEFSSQLGARYWLGQRNHLDMQAHKLDLPWVQRLESLQVPRQGFHCFLVDIEDKLEAVVKNQEMLEVQLELQRRQLDTIIDLLQPRKDSNSGSSSESDSSGN